MNKKTSFRQAEKQCASFPFSSLKICGLCDVWILCCMRSDCRKHVKGRSLSSVVMINICTQEM